MDVTPQKIGQQLLAILIAICLAALFFNDELNSSALLANFPIFTNNTAILILLSCLHVKLVLDSDSDADITARSLYLVQACILSFLLLQGFLAAHLIYYPTAIGEELIHALGLPSSPQTILVIALLNSAIFLEMVPSLRVLKIGLYGAAFFVNWTFFTSHLLHFSKLTLFPEIHRFGISPLTSFSCFLLFLAALIINHPIIAKSFLKSTTKHGFVSRAILLGALAVPIALTPLLNSENSYSVYNSSLIIMTILSIALAAAALYTSYLDWKYQRLQRGMITICAYTKKVKIDEEWIEIEQFLDQTFGVKLSHGVEPETYATLIQELENAKTDSKSDHS